MKISIKLFILGFFLFSSTLAIFLFWQKNSPENNEVIVSNTSVTEENIVSKGKKEIILAKAYVEPKDPPILRINQGGHKALIRKIIYSADGRYLISASEDKTIRVWNLKTGKTERIIRGQIGGGPEGKLLAMALSNDGHWLAVAGELAGTQKEKHAIRIYNFSTGKLQFLLMGKHSDLVLSLDFSPDSKLLVSGSKDKNAVVWNIDNKQAGYILKGHEGYIYAVNFTLDGQRIVTGSDDKSLKLWQVNDGLLIKTLEKHHDKIRSVAVSQNYIASGSYDKTINLWDSKTGEWIKKLATQKSKIRGLNFNKKGTQLLSSFTSLPLEVLIYDVASGKKITTYAGHDNIVLTTAFSPDSRWAASAGGNRQDIHVWDLKTGQLKQRLGGAGQAIFSVAFSKDGKNLAWGKTPAKNPVNLAINRGSLDYQIRLPIEGQVLGTPIKLMIKENNFQRAVIQQGQWSLPVLQRQNENQATILEIKQKKIIIAKIVKDKTNGYRHTAYTFTPNGQIITAGGRGFLTLHDNKGQKTGDFIGHSGDVWAVAVSPNGKLLASSSLDQTIRLWNIQTQELLISFFHGNNEWVAWTPSGYYTSSPNGDNLIGWQINQGVTKTPNYVASAQLRKSHYRPDIVNRTIRLGSVSKAMKGADDLEVTQVADLSKNTPPIFKVISHRNGDILESKNTEIVLSLSNGSKINDIDLTINNKHISTKGKKKIAYKSLTQENQQIYKKVIQLENGENTIKVKVRNTIGETIKYLKLTYDSPEPEIEKLGDLYIVSIGVGKYDSQDFVDLIYAPDDAKKIAKKFESQQGKRFNKVHSRILADGEKLEPTVKNIKQALTIFKNATENDTSILFISGHGENAKNDKYYYLLKGVTETNSGGYDEETAMKWEDLQSVLESTDGMRIVMIDACYAGNAFNSRAQKDSLNQNIIFMTATNAYTQAQQDNSKEIQQGVFTWALLSGLSEMADKTPVDKQIEYEELRTHVLYKIKDHTNKTQIPVISRPDENDTRDIFFANL